MWRGGLRLLKYDLTLWQNACNCLLIYHISTIQNCTEKNHLQKIFLLIFQSNNYCSVLFKKRCGLRSSNLLKENSVNNVFLRVIFSFHNTLTATYKYARRTTLHIYSTNKVLPNGHTDMVWNFLQEIETKKSFYISWNKVYLSCHPAAPSSSMNLGRVNVCLRKPFLIVIHNVKSVRIRIISGPYFPTFGLNK